MVIGAILLLISFGWLTAQEPVAIGLVRDDGYLIPITLIPSELFTEPSIPTQTFVNGEPLDKLKVPKPIWPFENLAWTLLDRRGTRTSLRTLATASVESHCADQDVWTTTLKRPPARPHYAPVHKLGIAVSGASVESPAIVTSLPDSDSRRVARRIVSLFLTKETARRIEQGPGPYALPDNPAPVVIKLLARHVTSGVSTYYFEATKSLKLPDGAVVPDLGLVTGWIVDSASGLKDYDVVYKINDDGAKENDRAVVHGIVPYQGRNLWLLEWQGYEWEYYTLHDWPSGIVRRLVEGGGC